MLVLNQYMFVKLMEEVSENYCIIKKILREIKTITKKKI